MLPLRAISAIAKKLSGCWNTTLDSASSLCRKEISCCAESVVFSIGGLTGESNDFSNRIVTGRDRDQGASCDEARLRLGCVRQLSHSPVASLLRAQRPLGSAGFTFRSAAHMLSRLKERAEASKEAGALDGHRVSSRPRMIIHTGFFTRNAERFGNSR